MRDKNVELLYVSDIWDKECLLVFHIECSRAVLQELARHKTQSLTVKSTRYTLKELKNEKPFYEGKLLFPNAEPGKKLGRVYYYDRAAKYVVFTNDNIVNENIIENLERLRQVVSLNISNDIAKYSLPEAFKTSLQLSLNLRSLLNLLELRTSKDALWEFREIAFKMIDELPDDYKKLVLENEKIKKNYEKYKETNQ